MFHKRRDFEQKKELGFPWAQTRKRSVFSSRGNTGSEAMSQSLLGKACKAMGHGEGHGEGPWEETGLKKRLKLHCGGSRMTC